jgi:N-acetyl-anhydromuramyl-L-alanine amidase AmpD
MTLAALKASLAIWKRRLSARKKLLAAAKQDLLEVRAADVHPRQHFIDKVALRETQVKEAEDLITRRERQIAAKHQGSVRRPAERVKVNVCNQSSRNGVKPTVIVLHDTEGANVPNSIVDLQSLASWFNNPSAQASSHVGVDSDGYAAKFVDDNNKAWTQAAYNPKSLSIEQVGFATQTAWPEAQLNKAAQYIAYWSKKYDIPIVHSTSHGVCQHRDLGAAGGGHHDVSETYPLARVLEKAKAYRANGW